MSNKSRKWKANQREIDRLYGGRLTKEHLIKVLKQGQEQYGFSSQTGDMKFLSTMLTGEHYSGIDWVDFEREYINYSYDNPNVDGDPDNGDYVIEDMVHFDDAIGIINCKQNNFNCEEKWLTEMMDEKIIFANIIKKNIRGNYMKIYTREEMAKKFKEIILVEFTKELKVKPYCHQCETSEFGYTDRIDLNRDVFYYAEHFADNEAGWHDATITFVEHAGLAVFRDAMKVVCAWDTSDYFDEEVDWKKDISTYTLKESK